MKLYDYQEKLLKDYKEKSKVAVKHCRQIGVTTTLILHLADEIKSGNNKKIYIIKPKLDYSIELLNLVKIKLDNLDELKLEIIEIKQTLIRLSNNNEILIIPVGTINYEDKVDLVIIDDAAFIDGLSGILTKFVGVTNKIILTSSNNPRAINNDFNQIIKNSSGYTKRIIDWTLNPNHNIDWYNKTKKLYDDDILFSQIIELKDTPNINKLKVNNINVRLDNETLLKLTKKSIQYNLTLSECIRKLIRETI